MKLYILKVRAEYQSSTVKSPWNPWYDKAFGYVVRAKNKTNARELASKESDMDWRDKEYTTCRRLKNSGLEEVILEDFSAA